MARSKEERLSELFYAVLCATTINNPDMTGSYMLRFTLPVFSSLSRAKFNSVGFCRVFARVVFVRFSLGGGSEFRLAMTDRATIAGIEVAKLVLWNSLLK